MQPTQSTFKRYFLRKDKTAADSLFAEFIISSGTPFAITESPLHHKFLAAVARYGSNYTPPYRKKLSTLLLVQAFHACMHAWKARRTQCVSA